jgi:hypothetical protein
MRTFIASIILLLSALAFQVANVTVTGGSANGMIDSFDVIMDAALVPGLSLVGMLVLVASLVIAGSLAIRFVGRE